ncbi:class I SAM-dependent methyltransferase [Aeromonas sp. V90_14]|uniref:class I SAM-dependent methyltransferase n=1 Tax=Aeromonas sp. V90_14 TaxID=3044241 RepID=UPI00249F3B42|nr:class I SAM-dependent methyltransferase [Aeromonas sp. V90_14]MDI3430371.1 class I SAM-dependent methyltransferase [Aeromonas sp. V90_14]
MHILIYGTSTQALHFLPALALNHTLQGFVDSDPAKQGSHWMNKPVYHPSQLAGLQFDKIIIASCFVSEINQTLASYGIKPGIPVEEFDEIVVQTSREYENALQAVRSKREDSLPKIPLLQHHIEGAALLTDRLALLEKLPTQGVVAELGVAAGDFSRQIVDICAPAQLHLVDIWSSDRYGEELYLSVKNHFQQQQQCGEVIIHRKPSLEALESFPDQTFDWVYIDTTHSYELTREELRACDRKVKSAGIIAGHDYIQGNWRSQYRYGVIEAVHEFCVECNYRIIYLTMDISECLSFALIKNSDDALQ